jgi:hypothetical protein
MMIASITLGPGGQTIEVSGFTAEGLRVPLVELRGGPLGRPLNLTVDQADEIAVALQLAARRARGEPVETELDRLLAKRKH